MAEFCLVLRKVKHLVFNSKCFIFRRKLFHGLSLFRVLSTKTSKYILPVNQ